MSDVPQMGPGGNPFGFDLSELMKMLQSSGPVNFDIARQIAAHVATADTETGQPAIEAPIDATTRTAIDEIVRAAQNAVAEATGIAEVLGVSARCVDRREWATSTIDGLRPVLESLAKALGATGTGAAGFPTPDETGFPPTGSPDDASDALFGMLMQTLMPVLLGVWSGLMIGQLSHRALGQYDLPLPYSGPPTLLFVTSNVAEFAKEWELPADELNYALALRELVHGAQRSVPWVREHLAQLASDYVGAYEVQPDAFQDLFGGMDLTNPEAFQQASSFGDPSALLGAMRSERQGPLLEELQRLVSVLEGYTDVVVDTLGQRMVPSHVRIDEALRRHRLDRGEATGFVDRLLGLELDRRHYEEGAAFCRGIVERAGVDGLNRLWASREMVPTAAEFEAPGLWLARIDL